MCHNIPVWTITLILKTMIIMLTYSVNSTHMTISLSQEQKMVINSLSLLYLDSNFKCKFWPEKEKNEIKIDEFKKILR